jgi:hypothetical protein
MDPGGRLAARLESLSRRGLAEAAAALLGGDPARTLDLLARGDELPWVAGCCWTALAPLDIAPPTDAPATVLRRVLVAGQADPSEAVQAIDAALADPRPAPALLPDGAQQLASELWERALLGAYEDLWERVTWVYEDAGILMRFGRGEDIPVVLQDASEGVEGAADRVALLARQVVGRFEPVPAPDGEPAPVVEPAEPAQVVEPSAPAASAEQAAPSAEPTMTGDGA